MSTLQTVRKTDSLIGSGKTSRSTADLDRIMHELVALQRKSEVRGNLTQLQDYENTTRSMDQDEQWLRLERVCTAQQHRPKARRNAQSGRERKRTSCGTSPRVPHAAGVGDWSLHLTFCWASWLAWARIRRSGLQDFCNGYPRNLARD